MKIAITGANGFIGNYLYKYLDKKNLSVKKLFREKNNKGRFTNKFILNYKNKNELKDIDIIIHCAARVHKIKENPTLSKKLYIDNNILCTKKLAEEAIKNGVKKFIFISSIKVNGEITESGNFFSETSKEHPEDIYAETKFKAEKELFKIQKKSKLEIIIIRPPLVYGPGVGANFKILMSIIKKDIPLPFKNCHNKRSFIFIENLIAFIYQCCINEKAKNQIFTVSDNHDLSITSLIDKLSFYMNKNIKQFPINIKIIKLFLKILNKEKTYNKLFASLQIDPTVSYKKINFTPPYSVDYGLQKTALWYLNNQK